MDWPRSTCAAEPTKQHFLLTSMHLVLCAMSHLCCGLPGTTTCRSPTTIRTSIRTTSSTLHPPSLQCDQDTLRLPLPPPSHRPHVLRTGCWTSRWRSAPRPGAVLFSLPGTAPPMDRDAASAALMPGSAPTPSGLQSGRVGGHQLSAMKDMSFSPSTASAALSADVRAHHAHPVALIRTISFVYAPQQGPYITCHACGAASTCL